LLEINALEAIAPIIVAQIVSYFKATRLPLGLLITFNVAMLQRGIKRVVFTP
jgi:GxxExxY protein